jgi:hypothetical protein
MRKFIVLIFCCVCFKAFAQEKQLFSEESEDLKLKLNLNDTSILSYSIVKLNLDSLEQTDYSIKYKNKSIKLKNGNFRKNNVGYNIWTSDIKQKDLNNCILVNNGKCIGGYIRTKDKIIQIQHLYDDIHVITEHNFNFPINECDTPIDTIFENTKSNLKSATSVTSTCSSNIIYRMIIAYTPQFKSTFSSQSALNNFLVQVVESVNETYISSNLNVRARLAYAYQTNDSETGDKDTDFDNFFHKAGDAPKFPDKYIEFDEIWGHLNTFNADVGILLVSANIGGRAGSSRRLAVYGKNGSGWNYGVAHEIGHMFDLEHNREEFDNCCTLCFYC